MPHARTHGNGKQTLDAFSDAVHEIVAEGRKDPETLLSAPHGLPVTRLDETKAARHMVLTEDMAQ